MDEKKENKLSGKIEGFRVDQQAFAKHTPNIDSIPSAPLVRVQLGSSRPMKPPVFHR